VEFRNEREIQFVFTRSLLVCFSALRLYFAQLFAY
jgi:hypothetical protein